MNRRLVAAVALLALLAGVVGFPGSAAEHSDQEIEPYVQEGEEFDQTIFRITVFENGDVRWTLEQYRQIPLDDEEEIDRFEAFAEEFRTNETQAFEDFQLRAERLADQGTEATDREMRASDFARDAFYQDRLQRGVVQMSFRWENFAPVDGEEVIVSDVLTGFAILENQRLEVVAGGNLSMQSVSPTPDEDNRETTTGNETVAWRGSQSFEDRLEVVLAPESSDPDPNTGDDDDDGTTDGNTTDGQTGDDGETGDGDGDGGGGDSDMLMPVLVAFLLMIGVGGGAVWYTLSQAESESDQSGPAGTETTDSPSADSAGSAPVSEQELLSDEDLVLQLLEENGGRMRQVSIVDETEWSKSKVSMLLSDMEDDGEISKLRVGRENIISLAGEEPEAAGSPFEGDDTQ